MFLEMLNKEKRVLFLNLATNAANANGVLEEEEIDLLKMYAKQIDVEPIIKSNYSLEDLFNEINKECDFVEKKMILFELVGVMFSDKVFDNKENAFLLEVASALCISNDEVDDMISLMNEYISLYKKTFETITKE